MGQLWGGRLQLVSDEQEAGCAIIQAELDAKADKATGKLAVFQEAKSAAQSIFASMRDQEIVSYEDLAAGRAEGAYSLLFPCQGRDGHQQV